MKTLFIAVVWACVYLFPGAVCAVEETFDVRAKRAVVAMKKAAAEHKIEGAGVISFLPKGSKLAYWDSKMVIVGKMHNGAEGNARGANYLAIAYAKAAEMVRTLKDSGKSGAKPFVGETGWEGGCIKETAKGYIIAAFSGGPSAIDYKVAEAGIAAYQKE